MEHGTTTITGRVVDEHTGIVEVQGDMNAGSEDALDGRLRGGVRRRRRRGWC